MTCPTCGLALHTHCTACGTKLSKIGSTGLCMVHYLQRLAQTRRGCSVCGKIIARDSVTGLCRAHINDLYAERRAARLSREAGPVRAFSMANLVACAASHTGVAAARILSPDRTLPLAAIRAAISEEAKSRGRAYTQIAPALGGRDHSSLVNAKRKLPGYRQRFDWLDGLIDALAAMPDGAVRIVPDGTAATPTAIRAIVERLPAKTEPDDEPARIWCGQCDRSVGMAEASACRSQFCGAKVAA